MIYAKTSKADIYCAETLRVIVAGSAAVASYV